MHQGNAQRHDIDRIIHQPRMLLIFFATAKRPLPFGIISVEGWVFFENWHVGKAHQVEFSFPRSLRTTVTCRVVFLTYGYQVPV